MILWKILKLKKNNLKELIEQRIANQVDLQVTGTKSHQMTLREKLVCLTTIHQIFKVYKKNENFNVKKNVNISSSKILFSEKFSNPWTNPIRTRRIAILKTDFTVEIMNSEKLTTLWKLIHQSLSRLILWQVTLQWKVIQLNMAIKISK